jgi:hypothetical protein
MTDTVIPKTVNPITYYVRIDENKSNEFLYKYYLYELN